MLSKKCKILCCLLLPQVSYLVQFKQICVPARCPAPHEGLRVQQVQQESNIGLISMGCFQQESSELCRGVCLSSGTWSFSDMFWYVPSNSSTPRRKESKDFSRKDIDIETQQLEIGKVPSEGWGSDLFFQPHHGSQSPGRCLHALAAADLSEIIINYQSLLSVFPRNYRPS